MVESGIVIRGRIERREFTEPFRQCTEMLEQIGVPFHVNPAITEESLDFLLLFQSYPYEFLPADLVRLRQENPFAPFFFVLGACCEGMLRTAGSSQTGGPLDSPFYRYVHGWSGTETEQIRRFLTDQPSLFSLPLTAEQDEVAWWENPVEKDGRIQATTPPSLLPSAVRRLPSLILTHFGPFGNDSTMNRLLADEQAGLGSEPLFSGKTLPDSFEGRILADADNSPPEKILESIQRLRHQFADNDFTVYVDSPRIDEKNGYLQAGVTRVLPKIPLVR